MHVRNRGLYYVSSCALSSRASSTAGLITSQQTQSSWRRTLGDSMKGHILVIRLMYCTLYAPGRFNERTKKLPELRGVSM